MGKGFSGSVPQSSVVQTPPLHFYRTCPAPGNLTITQPSPQKSYVVCVLDICEWAPREHFDPTDMIASMTKLKRNGERGQLCRTPLDVDFSGDVFLGSQVSNFLRASIKNRSAVAPFRCLTAMPPEGCMRAGILPGCPSLDKRVERLRPGSNHGPSGHLKIKTDPLHVVYQPELIDCVVDFLQTVASAASLDLEFYTLHPLFHSASARLHYEVIKQRTQANIRAILDETSKPNGFNDTTFPPRSASPSTSSFQPAVKSKRPRRWHLQLDISAPRLLLPNRFSEFMERGDVRRQPVIGLLCNFGHLRVSNWPLAETEMATRNQRDTEWVPEDRGAPSAWSAKDEDDLFLTPCGTPDNQSDAELDELDAEPRTVFGSGPSDGVTCYPAFPQVNLYQSFVVHLDELHVLVGPLNMLKKLQLWTNPEDSCFPGDTGSHTPTDCTDFEQEVLSPTSSRLLQQLSIVDRISLRLLVSRRVITYSELVRRYKTLADQTGEYPPSLWITLEQERCVLQLSDSKIHNLLKCLRPKHEVPGSYTAESKQVATSASPPTAHSDRPERLSWLSLSRSRTRSTETPRANQTLNDKWTCSSFSTQRKRLIATFSVAELIVQLENKGYPTAEFRLEGFAGTWIRLTGRGAGYQGRIQLRNFSIADAVTNLGGEYDLLLAARKDVRLNDDGRLEVRSTSSMDPRETPIDPVQSVIHPLVQPPEGHVPPILEFSAEFAGNGLHTSLPSHCLTASGSLPPFTWLCEKSPSWKSVDWHTQHMAKPAQPVQCDQFIYRGLNDDGRLEVRSTSSMDPRETPIDPVQSVIHPLVQPPEGHVPPILEFSDHQDSHFIRLYFDWIPRAAARDVDSHVTPRSQIVGTRTVRLHLHCLDVVFNPTTLGEIYNCVYYLTSLSEIFPGSSRPSDEPSSASSSSSLPSAIQQITRLTVDRFSVLVIRVIRPTPTTDEAMCHGNVCRAERIVLTNLDEIDICSESDLRSRTISFRLNGLRVLDLTQNSLRYRYLLTAGIVSKSIGTSSASVTDRGNSPVFMNLRWPTSDADHKKGLPSELSLFLPHFTYVHSASTLEQLISWTQTLPTWRIDTKLVPPRAPSETSRYLFSLPVCCELIQPVLVIPDRTASSSRALIARLQNVHLFNPDCPSLCPNRLIHCTSNRVCTRFDSAELLFVEFAKFPALHISSPVLVERMLHFYRSVICPNSSRQSSGAEQILAPISGCVWLSSPISGFHLPLWYTSTARPSDLFSDSSPESLDPSLASDQPSSSSSNNLEPFLLELKVERAVRIYLTKPVCLHLSRFLLSVSTLRTQFSDTGGSLESRDTIAVHYIHSDLTPFRCLNAMPPEGSTRAWILPGCPSLNRGSREAEVGFEPRTFWSPVSMDSPKNRISFCLSLPHLQLDTMADLDINPVPLACLRLNDVVVKLTQASNTTPHLSSCGELFARDVVLCDMLPVENGSTPNVDPILLSVLPENAESAAVSKTASAITTSCPDLTSNWGRESKIHHTSVGSCSHAISDDQLAMCEACSAYDTFANSLRLLHTAALRIQLLMLSNLVDSGVPEKFGQAKRMIYVQCKQVLSRLRPQPWVLLLDFLSFSSPDGSSFDTRLRSSLNLSEQIPPTNTSATASTISEPTLISINADAFEVVLTTTSCDDPRPCDLAKFSGHTARLCFLDFVDQLEPYLSVDRQFTPDNFPGPYLFMEGGLGDLVITTNSANDCSLYNERFRIRSPAELSVDSTLRFRLLRSLTPSPGNLEINGYIWARIAPSIYVHIQSFMIALLDSIVELFDLRDMFSRARKSAEGQMINTQAPTSPRFLLDIVLADPRFVVPVSSHSPEALVVVMDRLMVKTACLCTHDEVDFVSPIDESRRYRPHCFQRLPVSDPLFQCRCCPSSSASQESSPMLAGSSSDDCHAIRRSHEGWDTSRSPEPRQGGSREAEVGFEPRTFRSVNSRSNHLDPVDAEIGNCVLERIHLDLSNAVIYHGVRCSKANHVEPEPMADQFVQLKRPFGATGRRHEGWDTARLPKPRQGKSRGRGRVRTTDLLVNPVDAEIGNCVLERIHLDLSNAVIYHGVRCSKANHVEPEPMADQFVQLKRPFGATGRRHEGWDTARLPKPRQGKSRGRGRVRTTDLLVTSSPIVPSSDALVQCLHFSDYLVTPGQQPNRLRRTLFDAKSMQFRLERNLHSARSHHSPDWRLVTPLTDIQIYLNEHIYSVVRGLLSHNFGDAGSGKDKTESSSAGSLLDRFKLPQLRDLRHPSYYPLKAGLQTAITGIPWTVFSFEIPMENVRFLCFDDANGSSGSGEHSRIDFRLACFSFDALSDRRVFVGLQCTKVRFIDPQMNKAIIAPVDPLLHDGVQSRGSRPNSMTSSVVYCFWLQYIMDLHGSAALWLHLDRMRILYHHNAFSRLLVFLKSPPSSKCSVDQLLRSPLSHISCAQKTPSLSWLDHVRLSCLGNSTFTFIVVLFTFPYRNSVVCRPFYSDWLSYGTILLAYSDLNGVWKTTVPCAHLCLHTVSLRLTCDRRAHHIVDLQSARLDLSRDQPVHSTSQQSLPGVRRQCSQPMSLSNSVATGRLWRGWTNWQHMDSTPPPRPPKLNVVCTTSNISVRVSPHIIRKLRSMARLIRRQISEPNSTEHTSDDGQIKIVKPLEGNENTGGRPFTVASWIQRLDSLANWISPFVHDIKIQTGFSVRILRSELRYLVPIFDALLPPVTPFWCVADNLPEGSTRAGILPGRRSLNSGSRETEIGFEPRTFLSCLERQFTHRKVCGSNPTSASRLPLPRVEQPDSIPALVFPLCDMVARRQKGLTLTWCREETSPIGVLKADGFALNYFNRDLVAWEPALEPWSCSLEWYQILTDSFTKTSTVIFTSSETLNLNLTVPLCLLVRRLLETTQQDSTGCDVTPVCSTTASDETTRPDDPTNAAPFRLLNRTGCDVSFKVLSMNQIDGVFQNEGSLEELDSRPWYHVGSAQEIVDIPSLTTESEKIQDSSVLLLTNPPSLLFRVTGWKPTYPISVDRLGIYFRTLERNDFEEDIDEDKVFTLTDYLPQFTRLVIEVVRTGPSVQHVIVLRSGLTITNDLADGHQLLVGLQPPTAPLHSVPEDIWSSQLDDPNLPIQRIPVCLIDSGDTAAVPLNLAAVLSTGFGVLSFCPTLIPIGPGRNMSSVFSQMTGPSFAAYGWAGVSLPGATPAAQSETITGVAVSSSLPELSETEVAKHLDWTNLKQPGELIEAILVCHSSTATGQVGLLSATLDSAATPVSSPGASAPISYHRTQSIPRQYNMCLAMVRDNFPPDPLWTGLLSTSNRANPKCLPGHHITLGPIVRITNLLPCDLIYYFSGTMVKGSISAGADACVNELSPAEVLRFGVHLDGFPKCEPLTIPPNTYDQKVLLRLQDTLGRPLELQIQVLARAGSAKHLTVSAAFWLINQSGLPLIFAQSSSSPGRLYASNTEAARQRALTNIAAGQYDEHEEARSVSPLLFSFSNRNEGYLLRVRVGRGLAKTESADPSNSNGGFSPVWSPAISLDKSGVDMLQLKMVDSANRPSLVYHVGFEVREGCGRHAVTRIVTFKPRYVIENATDLRLHVAQQKCLRTRSGASAIAVLDSGGTQAYHWPREDLDRLLSVRAVWEVTNPVEGDNPIDRERHSSWSGGFPIDRPYSFTMMLHLPHLSESFNSISDTTSCPVVDRLFLRVVIVLRAATFHILLSDASSLPAPFRIENDSAVSLSYQQVLRATPSLKSVITDTGYEPASFSPILSDRTSASIRRQSDGSLESVSSTSGQEKSEWVGGATLSYIGPATSVDYAMEEPLFNPGGTSAAYDLDKIGLGRSLIYDNFVYLTVLGPLMDTAASSRCDSFSSDFVFDVRPSSHHVVYSSKIPGRRAQLWWLSDSGHIFHEGSSSPLEPGERSNLKPVLYKKQFVLDVDTGSDAAHRDDENRFVLDTDTIRQFEVARLVVSPLNKRRKQFQTWRIDQHGLLVNNALYCVQVYRESTPFHIGLSDFVGAPILAVKPRPSATRLLSPSLAPAIILPLWLRPGSGRLRVYVYLDGVTRVLRIEDEAFPSRLLPSKPSAESASKQSAPDLSRWGSLMLVDATPKVLVSLPLGIGLSVVSAFAEELVYASLVNVRLSFCRAYSLDVFDKDWERFTEPASPPPSGGLNVACDVLQLDACSSPTTREPTPEVAQGSWTNEETDALASLLRRKSLSDYVRFSVDHMQVNSQFPGATLPVLLFTDSTSLARESSATNRIATNVLQGKPLALNAPGEFGGIDQFPTASTLSVAYQRQVQSRWNVHLFKTFQVTVGPVYIQAEELLLLKLIQFWQHATSRLSTSNITPDYEDEQPLSRPNFSSSVDKSIPFWFDTLSISFIPLKLSVQTAKKSLTSSNLAGAKRLLPSLMSFSNAEVNLEPLLRSHVLGTSSYLIEQVVKHYKLQLRAHAINIFGSVDFLGNPLGFINDMTSGISGLVELDVGSLIRHVAHGVGDSAAKVAGSVSHLLNAISLDEEHQHERAAILGVRADASPLLEPNRSSQTSLDAFGSDSASYSSDYGADPLEGFELAQVSDLVPGIPIQSGETFAPLAAGVRGLVHGFVGGLTSMVTQPYKGMQEDQFKGFVTGFGRGILGTVTKPLGGILDLVSGVMTTISEATRFSSNVQPRRRRPRRSGLSKYALLPLAVYRLDESVAQLQLHRLTLFTSARSAPKSSRRYTSPPSTTSTEWLEIGEEVAVELEDSSAHPVESKEVIHALQSVSCAIHSTVDGAWLSHRFNYPECVFYVLPVQEAGVVAILTDRAIWCVSSQSLRGFVSSWPTDPNTPFERLPGPIFLLTEHATLMFMLPYHRLDHVRVKRSNFSLSNSSSTSESVYVVFTGDSGVSAQQLRCDHTSWAVQLTKRTRETQFRFLQAAFSLFRPDLTLTPTAVNTNPTGRSIRHGGVPLVPGYPVALAYAPVYR
ncbi:hypothetical protein T265_11120 [Opisthorchis viverrini]|uniref:Vacuolar protein sorting-associated protein 13 VPS13 adaptor binding domain-containing protein n=1 Tax=Opisthorchis viverrini TaxID=6198 RepID=A0A074Z065_OPIVI|nr:hypothetical protein T265_11120 [Opisthorchis viverrini]KER20313.1 hypothetical protein T265_11120 [Opisthorchis viverrini]